MTDRKASDIAAISQHCPVCDGDCSVRVEEPTYSTTVDFGGATDTFNPSGTVPTPNGYFGTTMTLPPLKIRKYKCNNPGCWVTRFEVTWE